MDPGFVFLNVVPFSTKKAPCPSFVVFQKKLISSPTPQPPILEGYQGSKMLPLPPERHGCEPPSLFCREQRYFRDTKIVTHAFTVNNIRMPGNLPFFFGKSTKNCFFWANIDFFWLQTSD